MRFVVKITGKAFNEINAGLMDRYRAVLKGLVEKGFRVVVVTGGGRLARDYIGVARSLGVDSNYWLDTIGIAVSRLNALLLNTILKPYTPPKIPVTLEQVLDYTSIYKIVVLGGLIPGQSTAAVAMEVAEAIGADKVFYMSAIDHVYTKDPLKHPDAKPLEKITIDELEKLLETKSLPGQYWLLDRQSIEIIKRSKITVHLTHYSKPENITLFLENKNPGTIITP